MAIPPQQQNEAFFREVDDELRRAQIEGFWRRWGVAVAAGIAIALVLLGAFLFWRHHREQERAQVAERFSAALADVSEGKTAGSAAAFAEIAKDDVPGYRTGARFTIADVALSKGDEKTAVATLKSIEEDAALPEPFRQAALIRRTAIEFDSLRPQEVVSRLGGFARAGSPWFGTAGELVAIAYMKMNQPQNAGPIFAGMAKDRMVPDSIRARAVQMAGTLGIDAVDLPTGGTK